MECPLHCLPFQLATLSHINYRHLTNSITPSDIFCLCTVCYSFRTRGCWRRVPSGAESNYLKPSSPLFIRLSGCECDSFRLFVLFFGPGSHFSTWKKKGKRFGFPKSGGRRTIKGRRRYQLACAALKGRRLRVVPMPQTESSAPDSIRHHHWDREKELR